MTDIASKKIPDRFINEKLAEQTKAEADREASLNEAIKDDTYFEYGQDFQNFHSKYEQNLVR